MIDVTFSAPLVAVTRCTKCACDDVPTVSGLIEGLERRFPGIHDAVLDQNGVPKPYLNVYVNKRSIKMLDGLDTRLGAGDAVFFGVAVAGG